MGGVYIPPFKLAQMMAAEEDTEGEAFQRLTWDALRKSLNGLINKANIHNLKHLLPDLFSENLIRGRGLFCRTLMKSQVASPVFTPVYSSLVAVINTKFPELGELLLHRLVAQFKKSYKRNDKPLCTASLRFIAHLVNQQVAHELLALEILFLLLEHPTDDSVELACSFILEVGSFLADINQSGLRAVYDRLRSIIQEGTNVSKRTQYVVESLFAVWKKNFEGHPAVQEGLDLVEVDDQLTHEIELDTPLAPRMELDVFRYDPDYAKHEAEYDTIKKELLGEEEGEGSSDEGSSSEEEEEGESEEEEEEGAAAAAAAHQNGTMSIKDATGTDLVNLRRTIYLAIMSSLDYEEAGHKLLRMNIPDQLSFELVTMITECASQEKTYNKMYSLLAERFCKLKRVYADGFCQAFEAQYSLVHRLETNKIRNVAKLFAHLLATDAVPWSVLGCIYLTEDDTTSSSRIFIKFLVQELAEEMGMKTLNERFANPLEGGFPGLFPTDSARNMRFCINFFTSIGLGGLTDKMRDLLKLAQVEAARAAAEAAARRDQSSSSSDSGSSSSSGSESATGSSDESSSSSSDSETTSSRRSSGRELSDSREDSEGRRRKKRRQ